MASDSVARECLEVQGPLFQHLIKGNVEKVLELMSVVDEDVELARCVSETSSDTLLIVAARLGHQSVVEHLLDLKVAIDYRNHDGKTALHEASIYGHLDCVDLLLARGAQVDALKRADWTPLMLACAKGHQKIVERLVNCGADIALTNKDGWNPFHITVREGWLHIAVYLLETAPSCWNTVSKNGRTPLHTAAAHGHYKCIQMMMTRCKYMSDLRDSCGCTPLMDALKGGHVDVADLLVRTHEDKVNARDNLGRHSIHIAALAGNVRSLEYLQNVHKIDVNCRVSSSQATPLHFVAKEGQSDALRYLISCGADLNAIDKHGRTALHLAAGAAKTVIVKALLEEYGAHCSPDLYNKRPCHLAIHSETRRVFSGLVSHTCSSEK